MRDLEYAAGAWVIELPSILSGLRTTPNQLTGRTPFFLVYGAEVVLPSDLIHSPPEWISIQKMKPNKHVKME